MPPSHVAETANCGAPWAINTQHPIGRRHSKSRRATNPNTVEVGFESEEPGEERRGAWSGGELGRVAAGRKLTTLSDSLDTKPGRQAEHLVAVSGGREVGESVISEVGALAK